MLSFTPDWFMSFFSDHRDGRLWCVYSDKMGLFWSTFVMSWFMNEINLPTYFVLPNCCLYRSLCAALAIEWIWFCLSVYVTDLGNSVFFSFHQVIIFLRSKLSTVDCLSTSYPGYKGLFESCNFESVTKQWPWNSCGRISMVQSSRTKLSSEGITGTGQVHNFR